MTYRYALLLICTFDGDMITDFDISFVPCIERRKCHPLGFTESLHSVPMFMILVCCNTLFETLFGVVYPI